MWRTMLRSEHEQIGREVPVEDRKADEDDILLLEWNWRGELSGGARSVHSEECRM